MVPGQSKRQHTRIQNKFSGVSMMYQRATTWCALDYPRGYSGVACPYLMPMYTIILRGSIRHHNGICRVAGGLKGF